MPLAAFERRLGAPRRRLLQGLAGALVAAALPVSSSRAAGLPRVAVIGGGMAGVATAWLLDGACDVFLFEARDSLGGNIRTVPLQLGGQTRAVDLGAQYFHPGPYPTYVQLLEQLGLWPVATGESRAFVASITLDAPNEALPRFVSPILPGRVWPLAAEWNRAAVKAFKTTFDAAKRREQLGGSWLLPMAEWLATLPITPAEADTLILPWAAALNSGDVTQTAGLSARALMVFAAGALPASALDPIVYYVLERGMIEPLHRMVAQLMTGQVATGNPVDAIAPAAGGGWTVQPHVGPPLGVDAVVFAASGPPTLALLQGVPGTALARNALQGIDFYPARLALHADPAFAPADPSWWSFLNARVEGTHCEASMQLDSVLGVNGLWKSWITHRAPPQQLLASADFVHVVPSPDGIRAQRLLATQQGRGGLWYAGGYTLPFDSQETALLSALTVAEGLAGGSARTRQLRRRAAPDFSA
jgi:predicted NAD/FAD-binding protein